ncbi:MAG: hypothetical protein JST44_27890, partial [Cyanobacteria bacterium SZAS LIN-5]|nr:hypothetical protein [Cyanobacteria bacterium SZAS LIN-5]
VLANIFSWGIGGDAERERNFFRRATENQEAIAAYRKFLRGEKLVERPRNANAFSVTHFRQKIDTIQKRLPAWVNGMPARAQQAQTMMERLDHFIKTNNFRQANDTADEILRLLQSDKEETRRI